MQVNEVCLRKHLFMLSVLIQWNDAARNNAALLWINSALHQRLSPQEHTWSPEMFKKEKFALISKTY